MDTDMNRFMVIDGGVTAPGGFRAAGAHVGVKKAKKDLSLVVSDVPAVSAGCYTRNIVKAAPVLWDMKITEVHGAVRGVCVNSGNANACTGERGMEDCRRMAMALGGAVNAAPEEILVCSTGVIGVPMPIDIIQTGIAQTAGALGAGRGDALSAAEAIMTTDTFAKEAAAEFSLGGKTARIGAMAKGSGMIQPDMATLISVIVTDAAISGGMLAKCLAESVDISYNMISVDRDTSTNDTCIALANGLAGNPEIISEDEDYAVFKNALDYVNRKLAMDIARDGEGASRLMEVTVDGAASRRDARLIAKSVVGSSLFKAALFGADANWGRVICAMGYSGGRFDPDRVSISFSSLVGGAERSVLLLDAGRPAAFDEGAAKAILSQKEVRVDITLGDGAAAATAWGCDLTYDYVRINGDYRS